MLLGLSGGQLRELVPGLQGQLDKGVAGAWQVAGEGTLAEDIPAPPPVPTPAAVPRSAALPPPGNPAEMHPVLRLDEQSPRGLGGPEWGHGEGLGQPPLTIGVQGQQAGGAEQLHVQLLLGGAVGGLDCDGPELLVGGLCLGAGRRGSVSGG